jgi:hypothetical protein
MVEKCYPLARNSFTEKRKEMNEVSIIINGVRYDSFFVSEQERDCSDCAVRGICGDKHWWITELCEEEEGIIFKKSDKKFEI